LLTAICLRFATDTNEIFLDAWTVWKEAEKITSHSQYTGIPMKRDFLRKALIDFATKP
jgi:hypothetical protein